MKTFFERLKLFRIGADGAADVVNEREEFHDGRIFSDVHSLRLLQIDLLAEVLEIGTSALKVVGEFDDFRSGRSQVRVDL